ncbi:MAG: HDIG domain-containing protein [Synergistaceae bacterium]|nr:HDIG domain-containing protein [Synergistaceae bacterium]
MSSQVRKNDKFRHRVSGILGWFPRELYAFYFVPALLLLCVGSAIVVMDWLYVSGDYGFSTNKPSPRTYRAISPMTYLDLAMTDRLRDRAGSSVAGVIVRNISAPDRMKLRLDAFRDLHTGTGDFPEGLVNAFGVMSEDQRERLLSAAEMVGEVYFETATSGDVGTEWRDRSILWTEINKLEMSLVERNLVYQLLEEITEPRYQADPRLTAFVRDAERRDIPIVERRMEVGDVIVRRGETVTPSIARSLREQGYPEDKFPLTQGVAALVVTLALPLWMDVVARRGARARGFGDTKWGCVVFVVATAWICEAVATRMGIVGGGVLAAVTVSFLCLPPNLAFHTVLLGAVSGVFLTAGLPSYGVLSFLFLFFAAAMIGFYALPRTDSLKNLSAKVFSIAVFLALTKEAARVLLGLPVFEMMTLGWPLGETWLRMGRFLLFDFTATLLAVSLLFTTEGTIGAFTALKARELSQPSNPLLRKLHTEAPGTYHHSLTIGALAGTVASALGMDENLVRVGAYYHDIGKLLRPRHFVENQMGGDNIHDTLSPTLSAVAIISHVREGAELANKYGLPKKVKQFIIEHHGTTCVSYFYKKALAQGENVEREQFCYPGPKPQSRETALLMLMDSLEAAVRAGIKNISKITDVQELIDRVVNVKIEEKQLDGADFTFKELELIKTASLKALRSMYHTRDVKEIKDKENKEGP